MALLAAADLQGHHDPQPRSAGAAVPVNQRRQRLGAQLRRAQQQHKWLVRRCSAAAQGGRLSPWQLAVRPRSSLWYDVGNGGAADRGRRARRPLVSAAAAAAAAGRPGATSRLGASAAVTTVDRPATGRFTTTSDGYRMRTMSVRIDQEVEIDEEQYMNGEHLCSLTLLLGQLCTLPRLNSSPRACVCTCACY
jgi:hypothetical protein